MRCSVLPPHPDFIRKATACLHSFIPICADSNAVGMVIYMNMEQIISFLVLSIFSIPVIFFAIILCHGKGADMIAGFNTASPEEKAKWDETALCRAVGILLFVMVGCIELLLLGAVLDIAALEWGGGILFIVSTVFGLVYINKCKRFKRK